MTPNLIDALKVYTREGSDPFIQRMDDHSKATLIGMLSDLMTSYVNDRNSSTLRELITVILAGYTHSEAKIGYNGFKTLGGGVKIGCEVKPKNIRRQDFIDYREKRKKSSPSKLNGYGNFTDYTWARLEKNQKDAPNMLTSGFVDGHLLYILEFPFKTRSFMEQLKAKLQKQLPNGDIPNTFLRSADFHYKHYIEKSTLVYRASDLESYKDFVVAGFYEELMAMDVSTVGRRA